MSSVTFPIIVGGDGSTVTDDSNVTTGLANGGHRTRFVPALAQVVAVAANTVTKATEANASAISASAAAALAQEYSAGLSGTSVTSLAVGSGTKVFETQANKQFGNIMFVTAYSASDSNNYMSGRVVSYSGTTLDITVINFNGSGTHSDWVIAVSGIAGVTGVAGSGVGLTWLSKTTSFNAANGYGYYCDSSSGVITATLPLTPYAGDSCVVVSGIGASTNAITVARNGSTIMGLAEDMTINTNNEEVNLVYNGTTWGVF